MSSNLSSPSALRTPTLSSTPRLACPPSKWARGGSGAADPGRSASRPPRPHPLLHVPEVALAKLSDDEENDDAYYYGAGDTVPPTSSSARCRGGGSRSPTWQRIESAMTSRVLRGASLCCYTIAAAAVAEQSRIKAQNPIIEMDEDEMTGSSRR
uniref:Uncharacterized protein n=1 Tax=Zea mays TaxID=4577 RepID=A0A804PG60_MAIZE